MRIFSEILDSNLVLDFLKLGNLAFLPSNLIADELLNVSYLISDTFVKEKLLILGRLFDLLLLLFFLNTLLNDSSFLTHFDVFIKTVVNSQLRSFAFGFIEPLVTIIKLTLTWAYNFSPFSRLLMISLNFLSSHFLSAAIYLMRL